MKHQLLNLHFAQLIQTWSKSKHNIYSDNAKRDFHDKLTLLFDKLKNEDFSSLNDIDATKRAVIINLFFRNLQYLDNSILNLIPFEIVQCLKIALNDWKKREDNYIIVTTFSNDMKGYSFLRDTSNETYAFIKELYDIDFNSRLIQISLPKYLAKDYMTNVVLYHELGHFIEHKYQIIDPVYNSICDKFHSFSKPQLSDLEKFFPYLKTLKSFNYFKYFKNHLKEYFADVFASQYIGNCSIEYLNYIAKSYNKNNKISPTHPSTINRTNLVNAFLENKNNFLLTLFNESTSNILNKNLSVKYEKIPEDDFLNLIPAVIKNHEQLHYLFILAWNLWLNGPSKFKSQNKMKFDFKYGDLYKVLNNLIEKSIANYLVTSYWNKAYASFKK